MKYGKLTFIKESGKSADKHILWECLCDCGNTYIGYATKIRNKKIIGCKNCSIISAIEKIKTHGMRKSPEYSSWMSMKDRCLNKNSKDYKRYGGAGIKIFDGWINDFDAFFKHIGKKEKGQSIDRINNKQGYYPNNVRWANNSQQQRNKNNSVFIEWNGKLTHINDVAKELGISRGAAHLRLKRNKLYA